MKTNQLIVVAGIGIAAYLLISKKAVAAQPGYSQGAGMPNGSQFAPGTPGYAAQRQAMADQIQLAGIQQVGGLIGKTFDWLTRPSGSTSPGYAPGATLPPGVYTGAYGPAYAPDYSASNSPYVPMTEAQIIYGNTGYGEAWADYGISTNTGYDSSQYIPWEG